MDQDDDLKVLKYTATELNDIKDLIVERLSIIYDYISNIKDSRKSPTSLPEQLLQDDDEPINEDLTEITNKLNDFCKSCKSKFSNVETNIEILVKKRNKRKNNRVITNGNNNNTNAKTVTENNTDNNDTAINKETSNSLNDDNELKESSTADDTHDSDGSNKRPIRMVPIEKLMRPSLVNEPVTSKRTTRALTNKSKDTSIPTICINSDTDDSDNSSGQSVSKLKNITVSVKKLPQNLLSFMKTHGLKEIRNHNNEVITKLDETSNEIKKKKNENTNSSLNVTNNKKKVRFSLKLEKSDDDSKAIKIKNKNKKMNKQDEKLINLYKNKEKKTIKSSKDDSVDVDSNGGDDNANNDEEDDDDNDSESTNVKNNKEKSFNIALLNKNYKEKKTLNKDNDENVDTKTSSSSSSSSSSNSSSSSSNSSSSDSDSDSEYTNANKKRNHETDNNESDSDSDTVPLKQINDNLNKNKKIKLSKDIDETNKVNNNHTNEIDNIYLNNIINDTNMVLNNTENDSNDIISSSIYDNIEQEIEIKADEEIDDSSNEGNKINDESEDDHNNAEDDENNSASEEIQEHDATDKDYKNDEEDEDSSENNAKKGGKNNLSDSNDSDIFQPKANRKKKAKVSVTKANEDADNVDSEKPKRLRRIKLLKSESSSDDENESHNKGRKNIRKLLKDRDLDSGTKQAAREEYERKRRIEERQKLYNQVYDEEPEKVKILDRLVLDFDDETKEELLLVDKGIVTKLKPHQANGIKFMFDACFESIKQLKTDNGSGCILAHCMGLGKTLQVVTLCHTLIANSDKTKVHRALVICPLSTTLNWVNEFNMWQKNLNYQVDVYEISKYKKNNERANKLEEWHNDGGVMVLGYDIFRNLANESNARLRKKMKQQLKISLIDPGPDLVICDEGHLLKNEKTSLSKAVNRIRSRRRIVLTGTPLQNNLKEYYCMVQFVKPNLLGTYNEYMNRFVNPITNGQYTDSTQRDIQIMKRRSHVLHKLLNGCVQRRDYNVLAPFLPPKHEYVVFIRLTELQCVLYKFYMENKAKRLDNTQKRTSFLFTDFQNLQRIWTHPRVLRYSSDKFEQQQKKLELEESDSEGSLKDFIEDNSETTPSEDSSDDKDNSDDSTDKKKNPLNTRKTRSRVKDDDFMEEEVIPEKKENPTEWWMAMCDDSELDNMENSGKLILLFSILEQCVEIGDKLLVFSQSLYSLDVIEHFLSLVDENTQNPNPGAKLGSYTGSWSPGLDYFRLDGSTSVENRAIACKAFNRDDNPRARLFLISTRAGGLGINLTAANRVIIFDASWNPSHDVQSIFRVYRFGQKKPCYIYRFLAMGTMEEKIYERQVTKQAISKRVIDEQQIDRHYKENDLMELYNFDIEPVEPRPLPLLPKDRLFAELLKQNEIIYKFHEHDSLLENKEEETLNEEERKAAWEEFEDEKKRPLYTAPAVTFGTGRVNGPMTSSSIYGIRSDIMLRLLSLKARLDNPILTENEVRQVIPLLLKELQDQMSNGEVTLFQTLISLQKELEVPPMLPTPYQQAQQQSQVLNPYAAALAQMNPMFGMGNINMNQLMNMTQYKMAAAAVAAAGYSGASTGSPTADKYLLQHQQKLQQQVLQQQQLIEQTQNKYIKKNPSAPPPQMSKEIIELD